MAQSVGTLKTSLVADASGFTAGLAMAAGAVRSGATNIRSSLAGLSAIGSQLGSLIPAEMTGFIDFMANPKMLGLAGLTTAFAVMQKYAGEARAIGQGAQRLGMGVVEYQELDRAAKKSGSSIEEAGAAVNRMRRAISAAFQGQAGPAATFKELGLSAKALEKMAPDKALERIAQAILRIQNPMERARVEMELFGKAGANMEPLLQQAAGGLSPLLGNESKAEEVAALQKSRIAMEQTKNWGQRMAGRAAFNAQVYGEMVGSWSQGDFVGFGTARERLSEQYRVEESLKRRQAAGGSTDRVLGSYLPTALAPVIMAGSQAAANLEAQTQDRQTAMLDALEQIARNTDPNAGVRPLEAE